MNFEVEIKFVSEEIKLFKLKFIRNLKKKKKVKNVSNNFYSGKTEWKIETWQ